MKIHTVPDMVEMVTAKDSQKKVSEIDYRLHLHEWICHPDLQVNSHVRKVTDQISDVSPLLMQVPRPGPAHPSWKEADSPESSPQPSSSVAFLCIHGSVPGSRALWVAVFTTPLASLHDAFRCSFHKVILGPGVVHVFGVKIKVNFFFLITSICVNPLDCIQGWPQLAKRHWLLHLGHPWNSSCQTCLWSTERCEFAWFFGLFFFFF